MRVASAEANKLLKKYQDDLEQILSNERQVLSYHVAVSEDAESLRPDYNFAETQAQIEDLYNKIMELKHAINKFNNNTTVFSGLTIDQVLVRLPQLSRQKDKLNSMRKTPSKKRYGITGNVIDYVYTSFDPLKANEEYEKVCREIDQLQLKLDQVNTSVKFEVNL